MKSMKLTVQPRKVLLKQRVGRRGLVTDLQRKSSDRRTATGPLITNEVSLVYIRKFSLDHATDYDIFALFCGWPRD